MSETTPGGMRRAHTNGHGPAPRTPLMTTDELSQWLRVERRTIYRLIRTRGLPALRVGHDHRFDPAAVEAWLTREAGGDSAGTRPGPEVPRHGQAVPTRDRSAPLTTAETLATLQELARP